MIFEGEEETTPPESQLLLPLTPPATDERWRRADSDQHAVDAAIQLFKRHRYQKRSSSVPLTADQYELLISQLQRNLPRLYAYVQNKVRYDYDPDLEILCVRMPTPIHDFFSIYVGEEIINELKKLYNRKGAVGSFARQISNGGTSRIILKETSSSEDDDDAHDGRLSNRRHHRREPDTQFQHKGAEYPGVVVEISYTQNEKDLSRLAWDYITYSNGDIKLVVGLDLQYTTKEAAVTVWRPRYTREEGEELELLEAEKIVDNDVFRSPEGSHINTGKSLHIRLSDFATNELSEPYNFLPSLGVSIPYTRLAQLLGDAEEMHEAREPGGGGNKRQSAKSKRRTRKRKRSFEPVRRVEERG